jgi:multisubunit Na+/H+ antiporter MnhB subunit
VHPSALVLALYLLLVGLHDTGGGFAAGLVAGIGLVVRRRAGGPAELGEAAPVPPGVLLGAGLLLVAGYAGAGVVLDDELLASAHATVELGPIGPLELTTGLVFELGIMTIVIGLVLDVLRTLGTGHSPDQGEETRP